MKYHMLAIDIDGTLLDTSGQVSLENIEAIDQAREQGMLVVLCTGRGLSESRMVIETLRHDGPVVLACGACVADPKTGKTLQKFPIDAQLAHDLIHVFDHDEHAVLILPDPEQTGHDYLVVAGHNMTANTKWWFGKWDARVRHLEDFAAEDLAHALRIGIVGPPEVMPAIKAELDRQYGQRIVSHHFSAVKEKEEELHILEVFAAGVNKWRGLVWLAEQHGVDPTQIAAIGDHINDIDMIKHAACGIAMGNAVDSVKAVADRVTETNDNHGVAFAIDRLLSGEW
ncbi:MAG: Cof-type HAD-IIB family hydrolase [Phycisphaera sp.]|nr:Cof-type HAD-IIB family hydrolase [Phycisphaera sp.]